MSLIPSSITCNTGNHSSCPTLCKFGRQSDEVAQKRVCESADSVKIARMKICFFVGAVIPHKPDFVSPFCEYRRNTAVCLQCFDTSLQAALQFWSLLFDRHLDSSAIGDRRHFCGDGIFVGGLCGQERLVGRRRQVGRNTRFSWLWIDRSDSEGQIRNGHEGRNIEFFLDISFCLGSIVEFLVDYRRGADRLAAVTARRVHVHKEQIGVIFERVYAVAMNFHGHFSRFTMRTVDNEQCHV